MKPFRHFVPTEVVFGPGSLDNLGDHARGWGRKPLIVTGRRSARASGALDRAIRQLPAAVVFDQVDENPTTETCASGAACCIEHACDFVVALGGGSAIDAAKAIAVLARNPGKCADFFGVEKCPKGNLPILAIPTTAGTGSEVTPYSVVVDAAARVKHTISARGLFPKVAILDPELSRGMPHPVTVSTGLDALSQAMEGIISLRSTPLGDVLALETCRLVNEWLPRAADQPNDLEARSQMLFAAMLSGCVIAHTGTTLVHGMGYYFTLEFGLAHGLANALLLTPLFQYTAQQVPEKVSAIADALGCPGGPAAEEVRRRIGEALHHLLARLTVSPAAKDAGVGETRLQEFAKDICEDPSRFKNQPGNPSREEVLSFFKQAIRGARD